MAFGHSSPMMASSQSSVPPLEVASVLLELDSPHLGVLKEGGVEEGAANPGGMSTGPTPETTRDPEIREV